MNLKDVVFKNSKRNEIIKYVLNHPESTEELRSIISNKIKEEGIVHILFTISYSWNRMLCFIK